MDAHYTFVAGGGKNFVKTTWNSDQKDVDFDHWTPTHIGPESKLKIDPRFIKANVTIEGMSSINFMFIHVDSAFSDSKYVVPFSKFWNYVPNHLFTQLACMRLKFKKIHRCYVYTLWPQFRNGQKDARLIRIRYRYIPFRLTESKFSVHAFHSRILMKVKCANNPFYSRLPMLIKIYDEKE